jgi:5-methylcytosine-specific restriction endonuclease McrA
MGLTPAQRQAQYRARHPERVRQAKNSDKQKAQRVEYNRKWRAENQEHMRALRRASYRRKMESDPEYFTAIKQNRRTRTRGGVKAHEWKDLVKRVGGCIECGSGDGLHMHHVIWLSMGGSHSITNVLPLCQPCHVLCHKAELPTSWVAHKS